ncbi:MAG: carboxypeptidase regulatory-like domain-containing protein [Geobacteraceae bacterium]|nr:carboxypeptidase regulatory-like domain-containing protein [Geobacteraceae bacterium]
MKAITLIFFLLFGATAYAADEGDGKKADLPATISGQIMIDAKTPMSHGVILLFDKNLGPPPSMGRYWRVPDLITPLGKDGKFSLEVVDGTYYLQFSQKNPKAEIGPAIDKEYFYFHGDSDGNATPLEIVNNKGLNLGRLKAFLWTPDIVQRDKGITAVEGVVVDTEGKPVERAVVLAYYNPVGQGRPIFISDRTDKKGRYQLRTNDGGTFYLKVRSVIGGGKPAAGEYLNTTKEFEPLPVTLKKGEKLKDITLKVMLFTRPQEEIAPLEKREWKVFGNGAPKDGK